MSNPDSPKKEYIGDSVYVEYDGWMLTLTTNNGYPDDPRNVIHLEPSVYRRLTEFVEGIVKEAEA